MKNFLVKNRVIVLAFMSALVLTLQQFMGQKDTDWKVIGFAILVALLGVAANQWKGKGVSILGILGTLAGVFTTIQTTGTFTWNEFILSSIISLLTSFMASLEPQPSTNANSKAS